ncbi:hypothetical protein AC249_AIPGENE22276 [Exaiptasia diaphana]|nr:hypothetical protein AC249_AIPGENE22276 [Exaiptasia diaphana]
MNAVVQQVLDSSNDKESEDVKIIDITDDDSYEEDIAQATPDEAIRKLAQIPVDTAMLKSIVQTVKEKEIVPDDENDNLLSFRRPNGKTDRFSRDLSSNYSSIADQDDHLECPHCYRIISAEIGSKFCCFCGGMLKKNITRWCEVSLNYLKLLVCINKY